MRIWPCQTHQSDKFLCQRGRARQLPASIPVTQDYVGRTLSGRPPTHPAQLWIQHAMQSFQHTWETEISPSQGLHRSTRWYHREPCAFRLQQIQADLHPSHIIQFYYLNKPEKSILEFLILINRNSVCVEEVGIPTLKKLHINTSRLWHQYRAINSLLLQRIGHRCSNCLTTKTPAK